MLVFTVKAVGGNSNGKQEMMVSKRRRNIGKEAPPPVSPPSDPHVATAESHYVALGSGFPMTAYLLSI